MEQMQATEPRPGDLPVFDKATELAFDAVLTAAMSNIVAAVPFISITGVHYITTQLVSWVLRYAWVPLQNLAAFFIIDKQQAAKASAYKKEVDELEAVLKTHPIDSEEVRKAHEEFKKRMGNLIRVRPVS